MTNRSCSTLFFCLLLITYNLLLNTDFAFAIDLGESKRDRREREAMERQQLSRSTVNTILKINPKTQTLNEKIYENFLKENYVVAERLAADYLRSRSSFREADEIGYIQALCLFKLNRSNEARLKLKSLADSARNEASRAAACVSLGDSYLDEKKPDLALLWYEEVVKKFPNSDEASYAQDQIIRLGRSRQNDIRSGESLIPYYSVQVGSFSNEGNAKALVKKLTGQRFDAFLDKDAKKRLFRVKVGRLTNKEEARVLELALKQEGYKTQICP